MIARPGPMGVAVVPRSPGLTVGLMSKRGDAIGDAAPIDEEFGPATAD